MYLIVFLVKDLFMKNKRALILYTGFEKKWFDCYIIFVVFKMEVAFD